MLTELEQAIKTRASMRVSYSASQGVDVALLVSPCTVEDVTYLLDQLEAEREKVRMLREALTTYQFRRDDIMHGCVACGRIPSFHPRPDCPIDKALVASASAGPEAAEKDARS